MKIYHYIILIIITLFSTQSAFAEIPFINKDIAGDLGDSNGVAIGDLNGDGYPDIYVANWGGQNKVWINDGKGNFTSKDITGDIGASLGAAIGDLNGDGHLDIYVANYSNQQNKIWINDGNANFTAKDITGDLGDSYEGVMGDLNGDGHLDIYVANYSNQQNKIWINDGNANFTAKDITGDLGRSNRAVLGDLNNDGHLDIYVANYSNQQNKIWINDGAANFTSHDIPGDFGQSQGSELGDVNGDGYLDIYVGNTLAQNKLWINDANGVGVAPTFTAYNILGDLGDTWEANMADMNSDGHLDIYVTNRGQNKLWINDGNGPDLPPTFTLQEIEGDLGNSQGAAIFDANGDEQLDIYVINEGSQNRLWINNTPLPEPERKKSTTSGMRYICSNPKASNYNPTQFGRHKESTCIFPSQTTTPVSPTQQLSQPTTLQCPFFDTYPTKRDTGIEVLKIQVFLKVLGFKPGTLDAIFGPHTSKAITQFQQVHSEQILTPLGLRTPTGIWGKYTQEFANSLVGCAVKI